MRLYEAYAGIHSSANTSDLFLLRMEAQQISKQQMRISKDFIGSLNISISISTYSGGFVASTQLRISLEGLYDNASPANFDSCQETWLHELHNISNQYLWIWVIKLFEIIALLIELLFATLKDSWNNYISL